MCAINVPIARIQKSEKVLAIGAQSAVPIGMVKVVLQRAQLV